jgi:bla regulator protein BlaR1
MSLIFLQDIFGGSLLRAMSWTLIHSLWQGLLFAIVAGIIVMATKRSSSALRYNLLASLFFLFLVVTSYTFIREWKPGIKTQGAFATGYSMGDNQLQDMDFVIDDLSNQTATQKYVHVFVNYFNEHASLVVMLWFIVFCARFVKLLANVGYMQRIRHYKTSVADPFWEEKLKELAKRLQINKPIQLLQSGLVKVPMVAGFFKPVILFPLSMFSQLSPEQVEAVLLHELAHIRRRDYLINLLQHVIEIVFFFNPGVLWISSLIRDERENCCDDLAIGLTHDNRKFVHALLAFQEYNLETPGFATAFPGKKNHLLLRVRRILHQKNQTLNTMEKVFLAGCFFAMTVLTVAFSQTQKHKPTRPVEMAKKDLPAVPAIPEQGVMVAKAEAPALDAPTIDALVPPVPIARQALISLTANDTTPSKITTITIEPDDMIIYVKNGYRIVTKKNKIVEAFYHDEKLSDDKLKELKPMLDKLIHEQKMESYSESPEPLELLALKRSLMDSELEQERLNALSQTDMLKEQDLLKQ